MVIPLTSVRDRYLAAQLAGDRRAALAVLDDGLSEDWAVQDLEREVVQSAQLEIGRLWAHNQLSVGHAHMAAEVSRVALAHLVELAAPRATRGRKLLVACVEGERHDLPARFVADYLEHAGYEVRYLGADVPCDALLSIIAVEQPDLVALSVTMVFNLGGLRCAVATIRAKYPDLPLLAGGNALAWSPCVVTELGLPVVGDTPQAIVEAVERALRDRR